MERTYVIYKYRAPGVPLDQPGNDVVITGGTLEPETDVLVTHPVGETVTLVVDDPEEFGEEPREYTVLQRFPVVVEIGDPPASQMMLFIIVTDPEA